MVRTSRFRDADSSAPSRNIGTWGTGDLELTLRTQADLERARPLIDRSYQEN